MPKLTPVSWKDLIRKLRQTGFERPYSGGKYLYMIKGRLTIRVPNPHHTDIGISLLNRILKQAGIPRAHWAE